MNKLLTSTNWKRERILIIFEIVDSPLYTLDDSKVYLTNNNWDDWFEFETQYNVYYKHSSIGGVKIARRNQTERRAELPNKFEQLPDNFFSLGIGDYYYSNLKNFEEREDILKALNDIAFDLELFKQVCNDRVTRISLLRDISHTMVEGQLHRMAIGGAKLTNYDFKYLLPEIDVISGNRLELDFKVDIENKMPPSNIHVLIGKNGIGKTTILKRMIKALERTSLNGGDGEVITNWREDFSNIVNISFSAFDMPIFSEELGENVPIKYKYVGLINNVNNVKRMKTREQLAENFFDSVYRIIKGSKKRLWNDAIEILESDYTFKELEIKSWSRKVETEIKELKQKIVQKEGENIAEYSYRVDKVYYSNKIVPKFKNLSSGHKNILLTIAILIDLVEEKTLVLLDEPEEHLHPPLVSAFIRALSNLLIYRNGVGIIATHSPVIVQEVPKKCVWILRRAGNYLKFERPEIETFGENLGQLTSEIFGYEVMNSGFHKMLQDIAKKNDTYSEAVDEFNNELGNEAKAILKSYMYEKENK